MKLSKRILENSDVLQRVIVYNSDCLTDCLEKQRYISVIHFSVEEFGVYDRSDGSDKENLSQCAHKSCYYHSNITHSAAMGN